MLFRFIDPKVRRIFELEYADVQPGEGGQKPELGAWLKDLTGLAADKRPAHLAPFLPAPGAAPAQTTTRTPAGTPDPNKGTQGISGAPAQFTAEQIRSWTPEQFRANATALEAAFPEFKGLASSLPTPKT